MIPWIALRHTGELCRKLLQVGYKARIIRRALRQATHSLRSCAAVLAVLKIGVEMVEAVQNLVTAITSGAQDDEVVWHENGIRIIAKDFRRIEGF